jgi:hypothetical protein
LLREPSDFGGIADEQGAVLSHGAFFLIHGGTTAI